MMLPYRTALAALLLTTTAWPQPPEDLTATIERLIEQRRTGAYMLQRCSTVNDFGAWRNIPVQSCSYSVTFNGETRNAKALVIRPESRRITTWILSACKEVFGEATRKCARYLADRMNLQSNYQFPVAGIVLEDGVNYPFRDGVTIRIKGVPYATRRQLTEGELQIALKPELAADELLEVKKFGRLQGTTREQYTSAGGTSDPSGLHWIDVVRASFQASLGADRNDLLVAWLKANPPAR